MNPLILAAAKKRKGIPANFKLLGRDLIAGTPELGYFGEYTTAQAATYEAVSSALLGANIGVLMTSGQGWLGFAHKGKRLLIARRCVRYGISYNDLNARKAIDGSKGLYIQHDGKGYLFRGRLPTGSDGVTPSPGQPGGEWNELIYRVAEATEGEFARLPNSTLGLTATNGSLSWCMDILPNSGTSNRIMRGDTTTGVRAYRSTGSSNAGVGYGWRPLLEMVD